MLAIMRLALRICRTSSTAFVHVRIRSHPVEVGCSTNTLCCLQNIARELGRPVKWNPATLSFGNDKEAASHRLYWYQYRNPYSLPYFCK